MLLRSGSIISRYAGMLPVAEGAGEPYSVNRQVVAGAARAGASAGTNIHNSDARQLNSHPVPALNQMAADDDPDLPHHHSEAGDGEDNQEELTTVTNLGEVQENPSSSGLVKGERGSRREGVDLEVQVTVDGK